ncbi:hypothetical protein AJ80_06251 [Polytolypa hystricis UAMH7299]|uniref:Kinesin light chain n=1 Tax=Polytolypa hystricis (strain UAMH7299) TaxID=1447883 RepID=A0A2B7XXG0_POLH7|nr:hypothetical protein AJ80_06251 [Polytolypa hystricis UAMH7299]
MNDLAETYICQERFNDAEALQANIVDLSVEALGVEHPHTLPALHNLVLTHDEQGRVGEAKARRTRVTDAVKLGADSGSVRSAGMKCKSAEGFDGAAKIDKLANQLQKWEWANQCIMKWDEWVDMVHKGY